MGKCKAPLSWNKLLLQPPNDGAKVLGSLLNSGAFAYMGFISYGGGVQKESAESMRSIEQQVAMDSEAQFNIKKVIRYSYTSVYMPG